MLVVCSTDVALSVDAVETPSIVEELLLMSARCSKEYIGYMGCGIKSQPQKVFLFSNQMLPPGGLEMALGRSRQDQARQDQAPTPRPPQQPKNNNETKHSEILRLQIEFRRTCWELTGFYQYFQDLNTATNPLYKSPHCSWLDARQWWMIVLSHKRLQQGTNK